jgi:hypothetical protein
MVTEMHRDQLQILGEFRKIPFTFIHELPTFAQQNGFFFLFVKESITTVLSTQLATCFKGHVQKCGQSRGNLSGMLCHYGCIKTFLKK